MLKNMKVGKSLMLGFGAAIAVAIVIIVSCAILLITQAIGYSKVIDVNMRSSDLIASCRLEANEAARDLRSLALMLIPDDPNHKPQAVEDEIYAALDRLDADLKELDAIFPLEKSMLDDYKAVITEWGEQIPAILNAVHGDQTMQAAKLLLDECSPRLETLEIEAEELQTALNAAKDEAVAAQDTRVWVSIVVIDIFAIIVMAAIIILVYKVTKSITGPVAEVHDALIGFSEGKLDNPVNYESGNELGEMCDALRKSQENLGHVVRATSFILNSMAKGDFTVKFRNESIWVGEMRNIHDAIAALKVNMTDTLVQVNLSAEQVASGSEQVSTGAQALAQGATEQASAVEELSATIQEISTNAQKNAKVAEESLERANYAGEQVNESARNMEDMVQAMNRISESSQEISKIIATIENIAFQTNILALNAAVEAARAGSAGKGFAVVADEVRNLATKSDQAAKATKELIDRSINSVQEGSEIVDRVSASLEKTVSATEELKKDIHTIARDVEEEANSVAQVTEGIDQISSVVQTNSATSEESAATSEELSSQASLMKALMAKFKLHDNNDEIKAAAGKPMFDHQAPQERAEESVQNAASVFSKY